MRNCDTNLAMFIEKARNDEHFTSRSNIDYQIKLKDKDNWSLTVNDANMLYKLHLEKYSNEVGEIRKNTSKIIEPPEKQSPSREE